MNSRIVLSIKNFNRNLLLGTSCLLLQGCATWFQNSDKTEAITPASTSIVSQKESFKSVDMEVPQNALEETTKVGPQHLRALPRRPEKVEMIEIDLEEESEETVDPISQETITYTVQKGDTLSFIAKKFHVSLNQLVQANQLTNKNKLSIGQVLTIPFNGIDENADYIVKRGDSLSSIAKRFNTSIDKIRSDNHLKSDVIFVGQKLCLSGEKIVSAPETSSSEPIDTEKYIVQSGDILWNIARRCGMSVKQLMEINHISNPKNLRVGQVLYVKAQPIKEDVEMISEDEASDKKDFTTNFNSLDNLESSTESKEEFVQEDVKTIEEDNFEDLFDESNDIPVVPLEEIK